MAQQKCFLGILSFSNFYLVSPYSSEVRFTWGESDEHQYNINLPLQQSITDSWDQSLTCNLRPTGSLIGRGSFLNCNNPYRQVYNWSKNFLFIFIISLPVVVVYIISLFRQSFSNKPVTALQIGWCREMETRLIHLHCVFFQPRNRQNYFLVNFHLIGMS